MKDLLGREAEVGTWIAFGVRCGNSGGLSYGLIEEMKQVPGYGGRLHYKVKTRVRPGARPSWSEPEGRFVVIEAPSEASKQGGSE